MLLRSRKARVLLTSCRALSTSYPNDLLNRQIFVITSKRHTTEAAKTIQQLTGVTHMHILTDRATRVTVETQQQIDSILESLTNAELRQQLHIQQAYVFQKIQENQHHINNLDVRAHEQRIPGVRLYLDVVTPQQELLYVNQFTNDMQTDQEISMKQISQTIRSIIGLDNNLAAITHYEPTEDPQLWQLRSRTDEEGYSCFLNLNSISVLRIIDTTSRQSFEVVLPRRSLYVIPTVILANYKHQMIARDYDIISGKTIKRRLHIQLMFHAKKNPNSSPEQHEIHKDSQVETQHVTHFYNDPEIAAHFSGTRMHTWPKIDEFISTLVSNGHIYDIGCGNGRFYRSCMRNNLQWIGIDISHELCKLALHQCENGYVIQADALDIPLKSESADAVLCIAVMHHLSSIERRKKLLEELQRITRVGGRILVYAWSMEQPQDSKRQFIHQDILVPWQLRSNGNNEMDHMRYRYCHLFEKGELDALVAETMKQCSVTESFYDKGNWCITLMKHHI